MTELAPAWRFAVVLAVCAAVCACSTPPKETPNVVLPAAPPPGEPQGLAGLDQAALRVAFGAPAFVRRDGKVEMWRYDGASCHAFFFLYPEGQSLAVRHVETVPRGSDIAADTACLAQIRTRASAPVS